MTGHIKTKKAVAVNQKISILLVVEDAFTVISKITGVSTTQKEIAKALGITQGDLANRKKRGTLAQYIIDWGAERGIAATDLFPELKRLEDPEPEQVQIPDPPQTEHPAQGELPYGHDLVRLPRGDPAPLTDLEADAVEKALKIIRARGDAERLADDLIATIDSYYKEAITASHAAEPGENRKRNVS
jgi:hypothetical protein